MISSSLSTNEVENTPVIIQPKESSMLVKTYDISGNIKRAESSPPRQLKKNPSVEKALENTLLFKETINDKRDPSPRLRSSSGQKPFTLIITTSDKV